VKSADLRVAILISDAVRLDCLVYTLVLICPDARSRFFIKRLVVNVNFNRAVAELLLCFPYFSPTSVSPIQEVSLKCSSRIAAGTARC
jgi:hypothetical protein